MANDDLIKLLIGLTGAFAGWMLAQLTSAAKSWFQRRKIRALLLEELSDLSLEAGHVLLFYARQLQIIGQKGIGNSSTTGLSNFIFKNYYKDALLSLNQKQRISYQLIHQLVDSVNKGIAELKEMTEDIQNEHFANGLSATIAKAGEGWAEKVKAEYQHCASLQWQLQFHLEHARRPDLTPFTTHHENYLKYLQNVQAEIAKTIEHGKTVPRERFDSVYNPESFAKPS